MRYEELLSLQRNISVGFAFTRTATHQQRYTPVTFLPLANVTRPLEYPHTIRVVDTSLGSSAPVSTNSNPNAGAVKLGSNHLALCPVVLVVIIIGLASIVAASCGLVLRLERRQCEILHGLGGQLPIDKPSPTASW